MILLTVHTTLFFLDCKTYILYNDLSKNLPFVGKCRIIYIFDGINIPVYTHTGRIFTVIPELAVMHNGQRINLCIIKRSAEYSEKSAKVLDISQECGIIKTHEQTII